MRRVDDCGGQARVEGWIFDIYPRRGQMILWIKTQGGSCIPLSDAWQSYLYAAGDHDALTTLPCRLGLREEVIEDKKLLRLQDHHPSPVLKIPASTPRHALTLAEKIARLGGYEQFHLYNVDIPPDQMYLYENDLFPLAHVDASREGPRIRWGLRDSVEYSDFATPPLTTVELEVKTASSSIPHLHDPLQRIELHTPHEAITIDAGDEESKLLRLCETVNRLDPDIILTRRGNAFLLPYLAARAVKSQVHNAFILGRERSPLRHKPRGGRTYFSYGKAYYKPRTVRIPGRLHIDVEDSFLYPSCGVEGLVEVSRVCRMPLQRAVNATIGSSMTSLQMYHAVRSGALIPWEKTQTEDFKTGRELVVADRGGVVYEPRMGVHEDVGEIDFASLYPTLMMTHNLSPERVGCECCPTSPHRVPELGTRLCQKKRGLIPQALRLLIEKRAAYKRMRDEACSDELREIYDQRQAALKWVLVASFGYLGFRNARFGKIDAHIATCAFARNTLVRAIRTAGEKGFEVIHGIVDSLWLRKHGADSSEFHGLCAAIREELGLPISFEGRYRWVAFSPSRMHAGIPVLNRYYGVFEDGRIKARGIELQRHDTPKLVKDFQTEMLQFLAKAHNTQTLRGLAPRTENIIARYLRRISSRDLTAEDLVIQKSLSKDPDAYAHKVLPSIAAQQLVEEGAHISAGHQVRYVITDADNRSPTLRATAIELAHTPLPYDAAKYSELLISSANTLLQPLGYTVERSTLTVQLDPSRRLHP